MDINVKFIVKYGGISFIVMAIVIVNMDVSLAQYGGMSSFEACGVLCPQENGFNSINGYRGFWENLWVKPLLNPSGNFDFLKTGSPRPRPTAGGCNNFGHSCWGRSIRKRRR